MPNYINDFYNILENSLLKYIEVCKEKYKNIIEGTKTEKHLSQPEILKILSNDPLWKSLKHPFISNNKKKMIENIISTTSTTTSSISSDDNGVII